MEDFLILALSFLVLLQGARSPLPSRKLLVLALSSFLIAQLLDALDELPPFHGVFILGRGGWGHEFFEDGVGRLAGFALLSLWFNRMATTWKQEEEGRAQV